MMRGACLHLALAAACVGGAAALRAQAPAAALVWSHDPVSWCRFVAPLSLPAGPTYWTGDCPGGKASGLGMLRRRDGQTSGEAFYGEFRAGIPTMGVIDFASARANTGGFMVGRFVNGDVGQGEVTFDERDHAFQIATLAAKAVSRRYKAQGNATSAAFYEKQAKVLDM
ncbi:hypothetical protein [Novosphingobium rosa]|uniref:hypothetical protein n=1 Tax=Novosphingobium rosa TaxID=76978 RepID=UPI0012EEB6DC|nr:hypothetical protein [Novosphingobium rosa]